MHLEPFRYLGSDSRNWDFDSFRITLTNYSPQQRQPRHRHENPTYFFLLDGEFVDESDALGVNSPARFELLYHPAGAWHESRASHRGRVGLNLEPSREWLCKHDLMPDDLGLYRVDDDPVRASELLRLLVNEFDEPTLESQLLEIVLPGIDTSENPKSWTHRLDELLAEDRSERWTLHSLAHELAVHPVYLARVFRARYGCSVTTYLLRNRLLQCARGILDGHHATEVSCQYGFSDHAHFSRSFRSFYGVVPSAFAAKIGFKNSRLSGPR